MNLQIDNIERKQGKGRKAKAKNLLLIIVYNFAVYVMQYLTEKLVWKHKLKVNVSIVGRMENVLHRSLKFESCLGKCHFESNNGFGLLMYQVYFTPC